LTRSTTAQPEGPSGYREAIDLEFAAATKQYAGTDAPAVDALSLKVGAGEICVLVGPSGCGKTTAMRMVNRMIDITSGDILVGGRSVKNRDVDDLRREIGYVIQQIGLFPHRTIGDNIATVPKLLGWDKRRVEARVEELLDLIGLPQDMRTRYPAQLSGGQRQRVALMRALVLDPSVLLFDEPLGALDPMIRAKLQDELAQLFRTLEKSVLFVTHDLAEAAFVADEVVLLREGQVVQRGTAMDLVERPAEPFVTEFVRAQRVFAR